MIDPIVGLHTWNIKRIDAFKATNVIAILLWIGSPQMMRIDAAVRAEVVLRGHGVELVQPQLLVTPGNSKAG